MTTTVKELINREVLQVFVLLAATQDVPVIVSVGIMMVIARAMTVMVLATYVNMGILRAVLVAQHVVILSANSAISTVARVLISQNEDLEFARRGLIWAVRVHLCARLLTHGATTPTARAAMAHVL